jgi:SAM-dependent methyltransferase
MKKQKQRRFPKKFRFHVTAQFIIDNYPKGRVLDVGGGKGVLSYLLNRSGFDCTVVDPKYQTLPYKLRASTDKADGRILLTKDEMKSIKHINSIFLPEMVKDYDLIVGLHAHGCMFHSIEQCKSLDKKFLLLPCCVVGEPVEKEYGTNWTDQVETYAKSLFGDQCQTTNQNFVGNSFTIFNK